MDCFPDEVLLHIFSKLSLMDLVCGVRLVSWRFYHISKDASLWEDIDFSEVRFCETEQDLREVHQGMQNLLFSIQSTLRSLTFGTTCHDGGIFELFGSSWKHVNEARFPALRRLDYSYSYASPRNLRVAITTHPDIEELYLCHTQISFSEAIEEALHLPNLKVFVFIDSSVCFTHDMPLVKFRVMKVPKICTKLEVVELLTIQADLDDEVIQQFTKHCPNLKSLALTCSSSLSENAFTFINTSRSCLTSLELKDRRGTEPYLHFVLPYFPHLTHLSVNGDYVHLQDCTAISKCCPNLQDLIFQASYSKNDTSGGIFGHFLNRKYTNSLCGLELLTIAARCRKLRKLHAPQSNIDDESVVFLTQQCPLLEDIDFSECERLTKISLLAFSKNSPNLRKLHFQENFVGHEHLMNVLLKCRKLLEVFFDRKGEIKMASVPPERTQSKSLSHEIQRDSFSNEDDIPYIDMITSSEDNELRDMLLLDTPSVVKTSGNLNTNRTDCSDVLEYKPPMRMFHNHCPIRKLSLTQSLAKEKYLMAIVQECPSLTMLQLNGAEALTDDLVVTIALSCPNLITLGLCLSVNQSSDITFGDRGLIALIKYSRKLECLSFMNNRNITSEAVQTLFESLETTLPRLETVSLCVGEGYACSPSVIALYGLKYLTESTKRQLKSSATKTNCGSFIHLDFKRRNNVGVIQQSEL